MQMADNDFDDEDGEEIQQVFGDLHERFMSTLLDEIERERYPSNEMLDLLEGTMTLRDRVRIVNALLDKLSAQRYPSRDMVRRVARLVG
jgi:Trp operon repressor